MEREGLEPPNPMGADLQSAAVTNFAIFPNDLLIILHHFWNKLRWEIMYIIF